MRRTEPPGWPLAEKPDGTLTVLRSSEKRVPGRVVRFVTEPPHTRPAYGFARAFLGKDYQDYFFHVRDFAEPYDFYALMVGDRVTFEPAEGEKGPRALSLRREE